MPHTPPRARVQLAKVLIDDNGAVTDCDSVENLCYELEAYAGGAILLRSSIHHIAAILIYRAAIPAIIAGLQRLIEKDSEG